jgi:tetratricopeptide (TPR) repeat protein
MGKFPEALPAYQKAVEVSPSSDAWLSNLADDYRWLGNRQQANETYDKAIALAYKALQVNPSDPATRLNLGTYYAKKGDFAQGLKFIDDVLAKNPGNQGYLYNAAIVHALAGQNEEALQALGKAFKAGYPAQFAKDDPDLRSLAANPRFKALVQEARPAR